MHFGLNRFCDKFFSYLKNKNQLNKKQNNNNNNKPPVTRIPNKMIFKVFLIKLQAAVLVKKTYTLCNQKASSDFIRGKPCCELVWFSNCSWWLQSSVPELMDTKGKVLWPSQFSPRTRLINLQTWNSRYVKKALSNFTLMLTVMWTWKHAQKSLEIFCLVKHHLALEDRQGKEMMTKKWSSLSDHLCHMQY